MTKQSSDNKRNTPDALNRRRFMQSASLAALAGIGSGGSVNAAERPNILWITCEDMSPRLGYYGDRDAHTPHLDRFARQSVRYSRAFASAPLCTPARSCLITGVFASSLGTQHLRGAVPLAEDIRCFTEYLREAGYYCSNNVKEDYNFDTPAAAWDESSNTAHWRKREAGQPFFSVFNFMTTHQSRTRYDRNELDARQDELPPELRVDPRALTLPPYYPDTTIVRENLAAFYTQVTLMDRQFQAILDQLDEDGLAEDTIVFFYSDHGDGLPRGKRWLHDTGLQVPLMVRFPEKYRHLSTHEAGSECGELVSFVDFAPTALNLAGLDAPGYMQGRAFLGKGLAPERDYVFATRDRVDEVLMCSRSVRGPRYHYIRNFMPHRARMQRSFFSEQTPLRQEIRRLHAMGELEGHETWLMENRIPADELYDTLADPFELNNLADDPDHQAILAELKQALFDWMLKTDDLGLIPEYEMLKTADGRSPHDAFEGFDRFGELLELADRVGRGPRQLAFFMRALSDLHPAFRYWGATGMAALGEHARPFIAELRPALDDPSPSVRFAAAEAKCNLGECDKAIAVLKQGLLDGDVVVNLHASQILMVIGDAARAALPVMKTTRERLKDEIDRGWYTRENLDYMIAKFEG